MDVLWFPPPPLKGEHKTSYLQSKCVQWCKNAVWFLLCILIFSYNIKPTDKWSLCHLASSWLPGSRVCFSQQNVAPQQDGQRYLSWPSAVLIWVLISVALNTLQQIPVEYGFTKMEQDQLTPEERPNVKMLIRHVFTQGSNGKSLPLKCTNNRITQHNVDYNQTCIM